MKFFKLFTPFKIRNIDVSNRIVMPAMHLNLADNGYMTKKLREFYIERAKGGAGLIIVGGCYVDIYGKGLPSMISLESDDYIPKMIEFTDAVHKAREDVKICAQLYH